jgi:hypothetical protein
VALSRSSAWIALGDLEADRCRIELAGVERGLERIRHTGIVKLAGGQVQRQRHVGPASPPVGEPLECVLEDEPVDRPGQADVLGHRHELARRDQSSGGVVPANERLDPGHLAGLVEDEARLVVDAELASLDRLADGRLEVDPLDRPASGVLVEQLVARAALLLGAIHGGVGLAENRLGRDGGIGDHRDADAHRDRQLDPVYVDRLPRGLADAVSDQDHLALGGEVLEQKRELVAAEPRHGVHRAQQAAQSIAHDGQQPVARRVAARVVDLLEVVEIQEQHRELRPGPARALERDAQAVEEQSPIGQPGELVVERLMGELRLRALAHGRMSERSVELGGVEPGLDQVVLSALPDGAELELFVVVCGQEEDRDLRGRHAYVLEQRHRVLRCGVEKHAAARMIEHRLCRRRIPRGVRREVRAPATRAEKILDQPCGAVIRRDQEDPSRPCLDRAVQK